MSNESEESRKKEKERDKQPEREREREENVIPRLHTKYLLKSFTELYFYIWKYGNVYVMYVYV